MGGLASSAPVLRVIACYVVIHVAGSSSRAGYVVAAVAGRGGVSDDATRVNRDLTSSSK